MAVSTEIHSRFSDFEVLNNPAIVYDPVRQNLIDKLAFSCRWEGDYFIFMMYNGGHTASEQEHTRRAFDQLIDYGLVTLDPSLDRESLGRFRINPLLGKFESLKSRKLSASQYERG